MDNAVTLLPQPLSPTRQTVSPDSILIDISSTARTAALPVPKSSLKFLRRTPWARKKVEELYLTSIAN